MVEENLIANSLFPADPLKSWPLTGDTDLRRRAILGIIESYNSNYDVLSESIQNSVDALEDAKLSDLNTPFIIELTVNLDDNWFSVLDTGIGMDGSQVCSAFAPSVSFKSGDLLSRRGAKQQHRGYKGVGLTFLAYGTDEITLHSKKDDVLVKGKMQYGRSWVDNSRNEAPLIIEDMEKSPLDKYSRGTYIRLQLSRNSRPKRLSGLSAHPKTWETIFRTRTAIGQILMNSSPIVDITVKLEVIHNNQSHTFEVAPEFLYPHKIEKLTAPPFRFLDLPKHYLEVGEQAKPAVGKQRQDGLHLTWDTERIKKELSKEQSAKYEHELKDFSPSIYAFLPYASRLWGQLNQITSETTNRSHFTPGMIIGVNRQRLADIFDVSPARYTFLGFNILVIIHFDNAKPDYGRKTLQEELLDLARVIANLAVNYMFKQKDFMRDPGESPNPGQRDIENSHGDWIFNVKLQQRENPLFAPPIRYISIPKTEQDVVGLFNQLSALGVFPGIQIFATSSSQTYDCLVQYDCNNHTKELLYKSKSENPLGVSDLMCPH